MTTLEHRSATGAEQPPATVAEQGAPEVSFDTSPDGLPALALSVDGDSPRSPWTSPRTAASSRATS